jgi:hypothetical protein
MDDIQANTKLWCDRLEEYEVVDQLDQFDVLHLYPSSQMAYPDGYYDAMFFTAFAYDDKTKKRMNLGANHDAISSLYGVEIASISFYVDGSVVIRFKYPVKHINAQAINIEEAQDGSVLINMSRMFRRLATIK